MSLAVLARKTRTTAPRFKRDSNHVLNMTGRGTVSNKSTPSPYVKTNVKSGTMKNKKVNCCKGPQVESKPAPQMGYGTYLSKKTRGAHRPSGRVCCNDAAGNTNNKIIYKPSPSKDSSDIITLKKDETISCFTHNHDFSNLTGRCNCNKNNDSKCKGRDHPKKTKKLCDVKKDYGEKGTDVLRYNRINQVPCGYTKPLPYKQAGEYLEYKRTTYMCKK
jgi:hypothetical protein